MIEGTRPRNGAGRPLRWIRPALSGVEFIDENGDGLGVRLRMRQQEKGSSGG